MVEFTAVIQTIEVDGEATRLRLDISLKEIAPLAELVDREVTVSLAPTQPNRTSKERTPT